MFSTPQIHLLAFALLATISATSPRVVPIVRNPGNLAQSVAAVPATNVATTTTETPTCPSDMFLDDGACVPIPQDESWGEDPFGAPEGETAWAGHYDRQGRWRTYEQIPRRPDRPADYEAYLYPIPGGLPEGKHVLSGYDLDLPNSMQRRGAHIQAVGHGAVDLPQKRGTPIRLMQLDHQVGDAKVIWVGELMGQSVVTVHTVREGGRDRQYVVIFGHIDGAAQGLHTGSIVKPGEVIAFVGDTGSPELVHLHLETRRVRDGVDGEKLSQGTVLAPQSTIVCDPRNVLRLR